MEKECKISNEKLYNLEAQIHNYKGSSVNVSETIEDSSLFEQGKPAHDILRLRENVMVKLRNSLYLRTVLNKRIRELKKFKKLTVTGRIGSTFSNILGLDSNQENAVNDQLKKFTGVSNLSDIPMDKVTDKTVYSVSCPALKINIVRENFTLLRAISEGLKLKFSKEHSLELESMVKFRVSTFFLESDSGYKYIQMKTEKSHARVFTYHAVLKKLVSKKGAHQLEETKTVLKKSKMYFGTTYFRIVPKLLSDCLYMFFKLPKN